MKIRHITETTAGATSSGSVASVARPLGAMETRMQKPPKSPKVKTMRDKGKKFVNQISESEQTPVSEAELSEADLIVVPGMRKSKDKSFIPHKEDRRDHEVEMARSDLLAAAKNAMRMYKLLKDRTEDQGLMGWQQSYITLATDYLQSVADNLEYDARTDEMTGGVIAGGMSNFEEGVAEGTITGNPVILKGCDFEDVVNWLVKNVGPVTKKSSNYYNGWQGKGWILNLLQSSNEDGIPNLELSADTKLTNNQVLAKTIQMACSNQQGVAEGFDFKSYYPGAYSRRAIALGEKFCEQYGITDEDDQTFVVELINAYLSDARGQPVDLKQIKSKLATDLRAAGIKYNMRKKFQEPPNMLKKYPFVKKNLVKEHKCPECGGELVSEELMNEKKDACYYKVKSRYKVWPSAYASGALVKCRKKGSKNWGKSKK